MTEYDPMANMFEAAASTEDIDRLEKERIADEYGLRDVGNTHAQEERDRAMIEEYKRKNAERRKRDRKENEKALRLKYLKKANRVRKRKRILRKIKRAILPGVKNEDTGSYDNSDTEAREISEIRYDDTFGGNRKRYFDAKVQYADASESDDGPVIIESSVKIHFKNRPVNESSNEVVVKPIFIAFFSVDGVVQQIAILSTPKERVFTVLRIGKDDSKRITLKVGTAIDPKLYSKGKASYDVFIGFGPGDQEITDELYRRFDAYASKHAVLTLDKDVENMTNLDVCDRLIRNLLGMDSGDTLDVQLIHQSDDLVIDKYEVSRKADLLISKKNLQEKLQEGAEIDLHPENPWSDLILEYHLSMDPNYYNS